LLVVGPAFLVLSWVVEFATIGTLAFGIGLVCLAVAVTRERLVPATDRALIILSAIGSLTWNTETVSAFLLVGVGLIWLILSIRLLSTSRVETG
jgi:O-antigen ligase